VEESREDRVATLSKDICESLCLVTFACFTNLYKIRRNFSGIGCLIFVHTPENNRVSKEKR